MLAVRPETPRASRLSLHPPDWPGHVPGQHLDVRLTAPDGYTAQRSYSIASPPQRAGVELIVDQVVEMIRDLIDGAEILFSNEYESALIAQKTGWSPQEVLARVGTWVVTLGAKGVRIDREGREPIHVAAFV